MEPSASFQRFLRLSPFLTLLLTLLSFGLYVPYWLYTRTRILNQLSPARPIPALVMALSMGSLLMFMILLFQLAGQLPSGTITPQQLLDHPGFVKLMDAAMVVNALQVLWSLLFCHRLNLCTQATAGDPRYSSYLLLALSLLLVVNVFYLQYKINQLIDSGASSQGTIGLM